MSVPISYDDVRLAAYMASVLGKTGTALGWTAPDRYEEAVIDTMLLSGVTDLADATDIAKLRTVARYAVWKAVWAEVAGDFDYSSDGQSFRRSQRVQHVAAMLRSAENEMDVLGINPSSVVTILQIEHVDSPYLYREMEVL